MIHLQAVKVWIKKNCIRNEILENELNKYSQPVRSQYYVRNNHTKTHYGKICIRRDVYIQPPPQHYYISKASIFHSLLLVVCRTQHRTRRSLHRWILPIILFVIPILRFTLASQQIPSRQTRLRSNARQYVVNVDPPWFSFLIH